MLKKIPLLSSHWQQVNTKDFFRKNLWVVSNLLVSQFRHLPIYSDFPNFGKGGQGGCAVSQCCKWQLPNSTIRLQYHSYDNHSVFAKPRTNTVQNCILVNLLTNHESWFTIIFQSMVLFYHSVSFIYRYFFSWRVNLFFPLYTIKVCDWTFVLPPNV